MKIFTRRLKFVKFQKFCILNISYIIYNISFELIDFIKILLKKSMKIKSKDFFVYMQFWKIRLIYLFKSDFINNFGYDLDIIGEVDIERFAKFYRGGREYAK